MRIKGKLMVILLGAATLTCVVVTAVKAQDKWVPQFVTRALVNRIERQLDLSSDQKTKVRAILTNEQARIRALVEEVHSQQEELRAKPSYNEAEIREYAKAHEATLENALLEHEKVRRELLEVLTPEQRNKLASMRESHYEQMLERLSHLGSEI